MRGEAITEGHRRNRSCAREHPSQRDEAWFKREIAPKLDAYSLKELADATGLSLAACSRIRAGARVPHPSGFRRRVGEILGQAVRESTGEKQQALWEATDIQIGDREAAALQHRHKLRHKGFIPFDYNDNAQWRRIFEDSGLLRTLAHRMLLSVLGLTGDEVSYNGQWETRIVPVEDVGRWLEEEE